MRRPQLPWSTLLACALAALSACDSGDEVTVQPSAQARLSGTVLYRERMALPPSAMIEVRLEDVSRADAPADVLAEQTIATNGRQVPIPFELTYDPGRIEANRRYAVRAAIRAEGALMFTTTTSHAVLAPGTPTGGIEILVQRASAPPEASAATSLPAGTWRLSLIRRAGAAEEAVGAEPRYTVEFAESRLSGQAHCNRYTGAFEQTAPGRIAVRPMAATLMACPSPSIADEFLRALGAASEYAVEGESLRLSFGDGGVLTFVRDP